MFRTTLLAAALVIASAGATTAPAIAQPATLNAVLHFSGNRCPDDSLCLYKDGNFTGGGVGLQRGNELPALNNVRMNDMLSSWSNDSGVTCYWYEHENFKGASHDMKNGYRVNLPDNENDTASSVRCDR
ncbi:peptidase inhibitor family I36 protein [Kitasatospora sp. NPDC058032]|uniref:peptidase inhibitor family I36 protein n=1 Tax=Kitasatospora sp. NPDC058032 TaxID=3346307 RepID=UPI0036DD2D11